MSRIFAKSAITTLTLATFFFAPFPCHASDWDPKEVIQDPWIARLQQGRKQLTNEEEEELKKYGYTALEIMTYANIHNFPGKKDWDAIFQLAALGSDGHIRAMRFIQKIKWCYESYRDLLTANNGIKPGDIRSKRIMLFFFPPEWHEDAILGYVYLEKEGMFKDEASWVYRSKLRKVRQFSSGNKEDHPPLVGVTYDDWRRRNPWEESHKIIGVDQINGKECFVIESKHRLDPKYYLSKRVSWVEKKNFLSLHEEQFNRDGKLFVMIDKEWDRIKPWDYWSITQWNIIDLSIKTRSFLQPLDQVFDQGFKDEEFTLNQLQKPYTFWRNINKPMPKYEKPEDFPPQPQVRWEFWEKLGAKPELVK